MNEIGIRQGRLSPQSIGPIQRFPRASWKREFASARDCGFVFIDWLFAADGFEQNPIWSDAGQDDIRLMVRATGTSVRSLCADYFISHPLVRVTDDERTDRARVLGRLVLQSASVGIAIVVVPLLEAGEIRNAADMIECRASLDEALDLAGQLSITVALEADLPAPTLKSFLDLKPHPSLGVCYDTGNAAAKGFDVTADLELLGSDLSIVHIKDRDRRGASVDLGLGIADLQGFFRAADVSCRGPLVLETPRGDDPLVSAKTNLAFVRRHSAGVSVPCLDGRASR